MGQLNVCETLFLFEELFDSHESRVELHNTHEEDELVGFYIERDAFKQVSNIDADLDKYIENISNCHVRYGDQAAMTIVDDEIAAKLL